MSSRLAPTSPCKTQKSRREDSIEEAADTVNVDLDLDVFEILVKNSPLDKLKRWRKATLALNAARRFRYTLDLKRAKDEAWELRVGVHSVGAVEHFKEALATTKERGPPPEGFGISVKELVLLLQEQSSEALYQHGGVEGIAKHLGTNFEKGIRDDPAEFERRTKVFGSNTYPKKPGRSFFVFLWEASQDKTLIILMICATLSLIVGMVTERPKNGWYDGASIALAVILVIVVTAISDYKQSLQFESLSDEKSDIKVQVIRGGRRQKVSIYSLVVGDLVSLNTGDQVPADGVFTTGHSLTIDESSIVDNK